ncbi:hypothetical protein [Streptomyces sp. NPDC088726]|uniref:hypothetical protein n=1 Tax=Streptomyces sp. NPDC088726 TaxID=3365874 RepID=UPI00380DEBA8
MSLPRPLADLICLGRDLADRPRDVLLTRSHHQWTGAGFIATIAALVAANVPGFPPMALVPALLLAGPSWALDLAGIVAHSLWATGRIWPDAECECCGDDPDDGHDDTPADDPSGDGGLAREVETWLQTRTTEQEGPVTMADQAAADAARALRAEICRAGLLDDPAGMTDTDIGRIVAAARFLNAATGGNTRALLDAITHH